MYMLVNRHHHSCSSYSPMAKASPDAEACSMLSPAHALLAAKALSICVCTYMYKYMYVFVDIIRLQPSQPRDNTMNTEFCAHLHIYMITPV